MIREGGLGVVRTLNPKPPNLKGTRGLIKESSRDGRRISGVTCGLGFRVVPIGILLGLYWGYIGAL